MQPGKFYRYVNVQDSLLLEDYEVVKKTPRGCWIRPTYWVPPSYKNKFILDTSQKKFAWPTLEEAKTSFLKRKTRQQLLLQTQLEIVNRVIEMHDSDQYPTEPGKYVCYPHGFAETSDFY